MKKLKATRNIGIEEARQRLAELEQKHAKALRELQRAERIRVRSAPKRRRTFHGFPRSDCATIDEAVQEVPEIPLSQNDKRLNELRSDCEDEPDGWQIQGIDCSGKVPKISAEQDNPQVHKISDEARHAVNLEGQGSQYVKPDTDRLIEQTEKGPERVTEVQLEDHDISDLTSQVNACWTVDNKSSLTSMGLSLNDHKHKVCGLIASNEDARGVSQDGAQVEPQPVLLPTVSEPGVSKGDDGEVCTAAGTEQGSVTGDKTQTEQHSVRRKWHTDPGALPCMTLLTGLQDIKPVDNNIGSTMTQGTDNVIHGDKPGIITTSTSAQCAHKSLLDEGEVVLGSKESFQGSEGIQKENNSGDDYSNMNLLISGSSQILEESSSSPATSQTSMPHPISNERWKYLFEEEMPRRSPRLKSKGDALVFCGKPAKQPRIHKVKKQDNSFRSSQKENRDGYHFPKPPVQLCKNGVVVDFSLPDREFAKLKLDRIRGISNRSKDSNHESNNIANPRSAGEGLLKNQGMANSDANVPARNAVMATQACAISLENATRPLATSTLSEELPRIPVLTEPQSVLTSGLVQEIVHDSLGRGEGKKIGAVGKLSRSCDPDTGHVSAKEDGIRTEHNRQESDLISNTAGCSLDATGLLSAIISQASSGAKACEQKTTEPRSEANSGNLDSQDECSSKGPCFMGLEESFQSAEQCPSRPLNGELPKCALPPHETGAEPVQGLGCTVLSETSALSLRGADQTLTGADQQEAPCMLGGDGSKQEDGDCGGHSGQQSAAEDGSGPGGSAPLQEEAMVPANQKSMSAECGRLICPSGTLGRRDSEGDSTRVTTAQCFDGLGTETIDGISAQERESSLVRHLSENNANVPETFAPDVEENDSIKQQLGEDTSFVAAKSETQGQCSANDGDSASRALHKKLDTIQTVSQSVNHKGVIHPEESPATPKKHDAVVTITEQTENSEMCVPVLMQACLEHVAEGADSTVRSVALATYECPTGDKMQQEDKLEAIAVCLVQVLVIWTALPGQDWTVHHKWTLEPHGHEEFCDVQFILSSSRLIVLAGGLFTTGNGRIYGCSEGGDFCMDLHLQEPLSFTAMCVLAEDLGAPANTSIHLALAATGHDSTCLTKWTLDHLCRVVKGSEPLPVPEKQNRLTSLRPVAGNKCLLLGTSGNTVLLWNHQSCELLKAINCSFFLNCLSAHTDMGLLFLMAMFGGGSSGESHSDGNSKCALLAVNPLTDKVVCLDTIATTLQCSSAGTAGAARGQYVAVGDRRGEARLWNISDQHNGILLSVCKDAVQSIAFHQHRPLVAFGNQTGCVHVFSLC